MFEDSPKIIYYKNYYNDEYKSINILERQHSWPKTMSALMEVYQAPQKIIQLKLKDLLDFWRINETRIAHTILISKVFDIQNVIY